MTAGLKPEVRGPVAHELGCSRQGSQHEAATRVEEKFRVALVPDLSPSRQALLGSQGGPGAGKAFSVTLSLMLTRIESALFRALLQWRLHLPVHLSNRICGCGRPLFSHGHNRAPCGRTGALGKRGFSLKSAAALIFRKRGARVVPNMLVRDMDLDVFVADVRRLEVANGLPMWGGVQWAIDTTLVTALRGEGDPRRGAPRVGRAYSACVWLSWHWSRRADGPRRRLTLNLNFPKPKPVVNRSECASAWSRRGGCGGHVSWLMQRRAPSLLPCRVFTEVVRSHKSSMTTARAVGSCICCGVIHCEFFF